MNRAQNIKLLHVLLVLTFISAGVNALSYAYTAIFMPTIQQTVEREGPFPEQFKVMIDTLLSIPRSFFTVGALLYLVELAGGILMWHLRRSGFHCYTLARLLLLLIPVMFLGRDYLMIGDVMFAALFIVAYFMLFRAIGVFGRQKQE